MVLVQYIDNGPCHQKAFSSAAMATDDDDADDYDHLPPRAAEHEHLCDCTYVRVVDSRNDGGRDGDEDAVWEEPDTGKR